MEPLVNPRIAQKAARQELILRHKHERRKAWEAHLAAWAARALPKSERPAAWSAHLDLWAASKRALDMRQADETAALLRAQGR